MSAREMTCYDCDSKCDLYRQARDGAKDGIDLYLVVHSCKKGCPLKYDSYSACYPMEASNGTGPITGFVGNGTEANT